MCDDAIPLIEEVEHLGIPIVGAERPAVVEDDRLRVLRAPILVEDLNAIFGRDGGHGLAPRCGERTIGRLLALHKATGAQSALDPSHPSTEALIIAIRS